MMLSPYGNVIPVDKVDPFQWNPDDPFGSSANPTPQRPTTQPASPSTPNPQPSTQPVGPSVPAGGTSGGFRGFVIPQQGSDTGTPFQFPKAAPISVQSDSPTTPTTPTTTTTPTGTGTGAGTSSGTGTGAPATGGSAAGAAADTGLITSLLGLVANMYAGAGVQGGGTGYSGEITAPISDTATPDASTTATASGTSPWVVLLFVGAIAAGIWYWMKHRGKKK